MSTIIVVIIITRNIYVESSSYRIKSSKWNFKIFFGAQLIRDIGVDLHLNSTEAASSSSTIDTTLN